tara:strand:- start:155 stop:1354 length:1200 start_codon:yes stop_codon:yes gene_type:complete
MTDPITQALEEDKTTYTFDVQARLDQLNRDNPNWAQLDPKGIGVSIADGHEMKWRPWTFYIKGTYLQNRGKLRSKSKADRQKLARSFEKYGVDPTTEPIYYNARTKERNDGEGRHSTCWGQTKEIDGIDGMHSVGLNFPTNDTIGNIIENEFALIVNNTIPKENKDNTIEDIENTYNRTLVEYKKLEDFEATGEWIADTITRYAKNSSITPNAITILINEKIHEETQKTGKGAKSWVDNENTHKWWKEVISEKQNGTEVDPLYDVLHDNSSIVKCFVSEYTLLSSRSYIEDRIMEAWKEKKCMSIIMTVKTPSHGYDWKDVEKRRQNIFDFFDRVIEPYIRFVNPAKNICTLPYNRKDAIHVAMPQDQTDEREGAHDLIIVKRDWTHTRHRDHRKEFGF